MSSSSGETQPDPMDEFERQARSTGLTLPRTRKSRLGTVAAIVAVILIASVGLGVATGWMNFRPASSGPPGLLGSQSCSTFVGQKVRLAGATSSDPDPSFAASLVELAGQFTGAYGSCVTIAYPTQSGDEGLSAMSARSADFTVLESPPTLGELSSLPAPAYVLPIGLSSLSVIYHLPNLSGTLQLNGSILAGIYEGKITQWDAPAIGALNPGLNLPSGVPISVFVRGDATTLNSVLSNYLSDASASWNSTYGPGSPARWPTGTEESSGAALVGALANVTGAIGYVATGTPLPPSVGTSGLENPAGSFVTPESSAVTAAAAAFAGRASGAGANWTGTSLLDAPGNLSYPVSFLSYLIVYQDLGQSFGGNLTLGSAEWEMTFLWWVLTDGGYLTTPLGFVELPSPIVTTGQIVMEKVAFDGKSVLESTEGSETGGETGEF